MRAARRHTCIVLLIFMFTALALLVGHNNSHAQASQAELWAAIRDGRAVAMMRHALAPGAGDPTEFEIGKCETQRNLNDTGRDQAREIGTRFRENGIVEAEVLTSQWCRCRDTASLLALGEVEDFEPLNSFFQNRETGPAQTEALKNWLQSRKSQMPLVLVTHQVNITALTDVFPASGEIVVFRLRSEAVEVLGSIKP